ncbi:uncharacterized protein [Antedon mediterranea]|uniref:uncharacterized protein n=1 Tax=Antedon mediterranea TaxID=105859 RepID=UPI003AF71596
MGVLHLKVMFALFVFHSVFANDVNLTLNHEGAVRTGENVTFNCRTTDMSNGTVILYEIEVNGDLVMRENDSEIGTDNQFSILNVNTDDEGSYMCQIILDSNLTMNSTLVNLSVAYLKEPELIPSRRYCSIGDTIDLKCHKPPGNPPPINYTWFKDGSQFQSNRTVDDIISTTLRIDSFNDSGRYKCRAESKIYDGNDGIYSNTVDIHVLEVLTQNQTIKEGEDSVTLTCKIKPDSIDNLNNTNWWWTKHSTAEGNIALHQNKNDLTFNNVYRNDSGTYQCNICVDGYNFTKDVQLDVNFLDKPQIKVSQNKVNAGEDVELTCILPEGNPSPEEVTWFENKTEINSTNITEDEIKKGEVKLRHTVGIATDSGTDRKYTCAVRSSAYQQLETDQTSNIMVVNITLIESTTAANTRPTFNDNGHTTIANKISTSESTTAANTRPTFNDNGHTTIANKISTSETQGIWKDDNSLKIYLIIGVASALIGLLLFIVLIYICCFKSIRLLVPEQQLTDSKKSVIIECKYRPRLARADYVQWITPNGALPLMKFPSCISSLTERISLKEMPSTDENIDLHKTNQDRMNVTSNSRGRIWLEINNITAFDSGEYTCLVRRRNAKRASSHTSLITIHSKLLVVAGDIFSNADSLIFSCMALPLNEQVDSFIWFHADETGEVKQGHGNALASSTDNAARGRYSCERDGSTSFFKISRPTDEDAGNYQCKVIRKYDNIPFQGVIVLEKDGHTLEWKINQFQLEDSSPTKDNQKVISMDSFIEDETAESSQEKVTTNGCDNSVAVISNNDDGNLETQFSNINSSDIDLNDKIVSIKTINDVLDSNKDIGNSNVSKDLEADGDNCEQTKEGGHTTEENGHSNNVDFHEKTDNDATNNTEDSKTDKIDNCDVIRDVQTNENEYEQNKETNIADENDSFDIDSQETTIDDTKNAKDKDKIGNCDVSRHEQVDGDKCEHKEESNTADENRSSGMNSEEKVVNIKRTDIDNTEGKKDVTRSISNNCDVSKDEHANGGKLEQSDTEVNRSFVNDHSVVLETNGPQNKTTEAAEEHSTLNEDQDDNEEYQIKDIEEVDISIV